MVRGMPGVYRTGSAGETRALGRELARRLNEGDVVLLFGEMGTGKTCLVKGIAAGLGLDPRRIHSPSFIMVRWHRGSPGLNHVDLFRLDAGEDLTDLGLPDLLAGRRITVVEWAERLPPASRTVPRWEIHLSHAGGDRREIRVLQIPSRGHAAAPAPES
ncbi:MAG: tRNA (adenosine(37)-N6)-threonylcarbamoyltransferase complex ATPase subunit type 1 TsaE [Acidobacteriota bacterium]